VGSGMLLIVLAVIVVTMFAAVYLGAVRRRRAIGFDKERYPGLAALRRSTLTARYVGLAAGLVAFVGVAFVGRLARGLFLAPAAAGAVLVVAVMIGQQVAYGGARTTGVAGVERRLIRNYVPRTLTVVVVVFVALLVASATWTTVSASPDSLGLDRAFTATGTHTVTGGSPELATVSSTRSPFPGGFYTLMLAIGLPIVAVLGGIALWLTSRRPRNGADPELVAVDDALRRQTAEGVLAAVGLAMSLSLLGVALGAASAVGGMAEFGMRYTFGAVIFGVVALGSLVIAAWCTVLVLVPSGGTVKPS
jgi:hypothetical protein